MDSTLIIDIGIEDCSVKCTLFDRWRMVDNIAKLKVTLTSGMVYGIVGEFGSDGWHYPIC